MHRKKLYALTRSVSRSFYLTLRWLPNAVRDSACVAYLLARISDTLADTSTIPLSQRHVLLQQFEALCRPPVDLVSPILSELTAVCLPDQTHTTEQQLLKELPFCLTCFTQLPATEQQRIQQLLRHILSGQQFDLQRFDMNTTLPLTESELDRYTYQVAGCVGEYLSTLFADRVSHWSDQSLEQMQQWGEHYGRGLQLINILRDMPVDQQQGRYYLNPQTIEHTLRQTQRYLLEGWYYVSHLTERRLRFVCLLPLLIGLQTFIQWVQTDPLPTTTPIRIRRRQVHAVIGRSLLGTVCLAWVRPYHAKLQRQLNRALLDRFGNPSDYGDESNVMNEQRE